MTTTEYLINFALVGLVIFQIRGRKLTKVSLLVPVVLAGWAGTEYLHTIPTAGNDLILEVGFAAMGAALGAGAGILSKISDRGPGAVVTVGAVGAALWVIGVGSRIVFALWLGHGGRSVVESFSVTHHITSGAAWASAFILMALAEVAGRTGMLFFKVRSQGVVLERGGLLALRAAA